MSIVVSPAAKEFRKQSKPSTQATTKSMSPFRGERERRRKQIIDRLILGATLAFCMLVVFAVWYSEGKVLAAPTRFLAQFAGKDALASRNAAMNCANPKNRNTPYCQDRVSETEGQWNSLSRSQDGKMNAFTLHSPGN